MIVNLLSWFPSRAGSEPFYPCAAFRFLEVGGSVCEEVACAHSQGMCCLALAENRIPPSRYKKTKVSQLPKKSSPDIMGKKETAEQLRENYEKQVSQLRRMVLVRLSGWLTYLYRSLGGLGGWCSLLCSALLSCFELCGVDTDWW